MAGPSIQQLLAGLTSSAGSPGYGQAALNASTNAAVGSAMPSFMQALQGTKENEVARGISTGDLGTSFEGDLASAFQRNIANATAGQAENMFQFGQGMYADLLTGTQDYNTAQSNAKRQSNSGLFGAIGTGLGAAFGGQAGAGIGGTIGAGVGGYIS